MYAPKYPESDSGNNSVQDESTEEDPTAELPDGSESNAALATLFDDTEETAEPGFDLTDYDCGHFRLNPDQNGMFFASGIASRCDREKGTFGLDLAIYVGGMIKVADANGRAMLLTASIECFFDSESPRWKGRKPCPYNGRYVSVVGRFAGAKPSPKKTPAGLPRSSLSAFLLDISHITFMGGSGAQSNPAVGTVPNTLDSPTPAGGLKARGLLSHGKPKAHVPTVSAPSAAPSVPPAKSVSSSLPTKATGASSSKGGRKKGSKAATAAAPSATALGKRRAVDDGSSLADLLGDGTHKHIRTESEGA